MASPRPLFLLALSFAAVAAAAPKTPIAVSPGATDRETVAASSCPTFSWSAAGPAGREIEISIFAVREVGALSERPERTVIVPTGASSWTPPAEECLAPGSYAWTVRISDGATPALWAAPRFFRVDRGGTADLERAIRRVLERWAAEGGSPLRADSSAARSAAGPPRLGTVIGAEVYDPPDCTAPNVFSDVPETDERCPFIEQFAQDGIAAPCAAGKYCPDDPVTRGQLAVYLERAMRGTANWDTNPARAISIPVTALVDCESPGGVLDYADEALGSTPHFIFTGNPQGPVLEFDAEADHQDDSHDVCARLLLPPDYVAGSSLTVAARMATITPMSPPELLIATLTRQDGSSTTCSAALSSAEGIHLVTCSAFGDGLNPGDSLNVKMAMSSLCCAGPMNDGVQVHAIELRYTSIR